MKIKIPFNKPFIIGKELEYVAQSVASGHIAGDGLFSRKCSEYLQNWLGVKKVLLTPSGTAALEMAGLLAGIKEGDEVVVPSFTFVSTANAFYLRRAKIVFAEIREDTLNLDEKKLDALCGSRTKMIVPVHYGGVSCRMDAILKIAKRHKCVVAEDAAHGLGAKFQDRFLGSIAPLAAMSFHETKNCISGEGGALFINDDSYIERAEIIREKGTNRTRFFRGEVDKYTWVDEGSSYLLSDVLAAFLFAQLEKVSEITAKREVLYKTYFSLLTPLAEKKYIKLPLIPSGCCSNFHIFYVLCENKRERDGLLSYLKSRGIHAVFHYIPLHLSPMAKTWGYVKGDFPVTEKISETIIRLPMYYELSDREQHYIAETLIKYFSGAKAKRAHQEALI